MQSQTGALDIQGIGGTLKAFEGMVAVFMGNADAMVFYGQY